MKGIKNFEEYIEEGIVKRIKPDINRAKFLKQEVYKRLDFLKVLLDKVGLKEDNANYIIENCYNILSELLRTKMLKDGYSASGIGAHEAEVSFMKKIGFSDSETIFMNDLRYFRNGIHYYGKILDKEYAEKVLEFLNKIVPKLKELVD